VVTNFSPHYRRPLFLELSRRIDVTLVLTSRGTEWYELGGRPTDTGGLPTVSASSPAGVYQELAGGSYDAIIASLTGRATLLAAFAAAKVKRLPIVLWVEIWEHPRTLAHRLSRRFARALYRSADAVVTFGPHVADFVSLESGRKHDIFVAPQAVDNEQFRTPVPPDRIAALRERLHLLSYPTVTFVGRLEEDKGIGFLFQASASLDRRHQVVVAGRGPGLTGLYEQAESLGIGDRVRFVGHLDQARIVELLYASDVLVLPSVASKRWREPWGMVVNEAMNCGIPVVATDAVGAAAGGLVLHDQTGLVVRERDPAELALALDDLIRDESKRRRLGAAASAHVVHWNNHSAADAFESALAAAEQRRCRHAGSDRS